MRCNVLDRVYCELVDAGRRDRLDLFSNLVQENLEANREHYNKNLELNYKYLLTRSTIKVLKTFKRENLKEKMNGNKAK